MSYKLPPLIKIQETSKCTTVAVMTKGNISFRLPPIVLQSRNPRNVMSRVLLDMPPPFLWMITNSTIFLLIVLLDIIFIRGAPQVIVAMCFHLPFPSPLFSSLVPSQLFIESTTFNRDILLGKSSLYLLLPFKYSDKRPFFINPSMKSFSLI